MTAIRQLLPLMTFVYAWIVPLWAAQLLPPLLMEKFDTLRISPVPVQCDWDKIRTEMKPIKMARARA